MVVTIENISHSSVIFDTLRGHLHWKFVAAFSSAKMLDELKD